MTFECVIRLFVTMCVCVWASLIRISQHKDKANHCMSPHSDVPFSPLLKQTSLLHILCIFELGNLFSPGSDFKCLSLLILMSMFMSPSCLFMCKMWVSWCGRAHPWFWNGSYWYVPLGWSYIDLVISLPASAELAWVGQEGFYWLFERSKLKKSHSLSLPLSLSYIICCWLNTNGGSSFD